MADTVVDTARRIRQRQADIDGKVDSKSNSKRKNTKSSKKRKNTGDTVSEILKNERKGSEGERSFGTPFDRQTTDSNNK